MRQVTVKVKVENSREGMALPAKILEKRLMSVGNQAG